MLATLVGYNMVESGSNSFVVAYVATDRQITFGTEYHSCVLSSKYWSETISPAFKSGRAVHVGFDKNKKGKPFLYVKS